MRKLMATILCLVVALFLISCENSAAAPALETEPIPVLDTSSAVFTFPEGCVVGGIDLAGMLGVDAYSVLNEAVDNYMLQLKINDEVMVFCAEDIELTYSSERMQEYVTALKEGKDPRSIVPFTYNKGLLRHEIAAQLFELPVNPGLIYDANAHSYVFTEYTPGTGYDLDIVMEALDPVILSLGTECSVTVAPIELAPSITADSEGGKKVLEKANGLLTALSYSFTPKSSRTLTVTLDADAVGSFLSFDGDYNPIVDEAALGQYAEELGELYSVGLNDGVFLTSGGEYVNMKINYAKQLVDTEALAEDILYCYENGITGTREAPYEKAERSGHPYDLGGSYVEINLTEQRLWVYDNYECKMYTPIVTGNLSEEWDTPTGIYSVYQRIYPTRPGRVFRYWMPFLGAFGLHDASWRSEFRDDEYLFEGSHGCVNIPPENFKAVYKYVEVGTPVVIYGSARTSPVEQVISGPTQYNVGVNVGKFTLDATPKYGEKKYLSYSSDNTDILTVSKQGVVTVKGTGTAHITIKSKNWDFCPSIQKVITVNVYEDCSEVGHMIVNWKTTKEATCTSTGTEVGTCTSCDYSVTVTTGHVHDFYFAAYMHDQSWVVTKWPTCSEAGEKVRTCEDCGYQEVMTIPAVDHVATCLFFTTPEVLDKTGKLVGSCYFCGMEMTQDVPAITE